VENNERIKDLILNGEFDEIKGLLNMSDTDRLEGMLMALAYEDTGNITPYFFINNLILEDESAELHAIASALMSGPFCWMKGAYRLGMEHMKKAIELDTENPSYKQGILLFNIIPERLLSDNEALKYAKQIIAINPEDVTAIETIKDINRARNR
jgi:hypothetical protein